MQCQEFIATLSRFRTPARTERLAWLSVFFVSGTTVITTRDNISWQWRRWQPNTIPTWHHVVLITLKSVEFALFCRMVKFRATSAFDSITNFIPVSQIIYIQREWARSSKVKRRGHSGRGYTFWMFFFVHLFFFHFPQVVDIWMFSPFPKIGIRQAGHRQNRICHTHQWLL